MSHSDPSDVARELAAAALAGAVNATASSSGHKMVLVVRRDLHMGVGKIAAQCAHAAVGIYRAVMSTNPSHMTHWLEHGQAKIVCRVNSHEEMMALADQARAVHLPVYLVADAGRTQVPQGSHTVLAVGPGDTQLVDRITSHLKLL